MSTPKSLQEAIQNGIDEYNQFIIHSSVDSIQGNFLKQILDKHIRDFLAQRLGAEMLNAETDVVANALRGAYDRLF